MRRVLYGLLLVLAAAAPAAAQFPSRPVTMIVAFAAGGPSDTVGRLIAEAMTRELGQTVLVENVAGAGGTLAAARVAQAEADGHTLLLHHVSLATAVSLYSNLTYDTERAFAPIGLVSDVPVVVLGRADLPPNDVASLLGFLKENGGEVTAGTAGIGSGAHLCAVLMGRALGTELTLVSYKGTGPAMTDLLGGQIDLLCDQATTASPQVRAGKVKAYAVTSEGRADGFPDLPTLREAGLQDFELSIWHGLYAPAGTPDEAVATLTRALQAALRDEKVRTRFGELSTEPAAEGDATPAALQQQLSSEITRWRAILAAAGVQPN